jgi:hypothetical protein
MRKKLTAAAILLDILGTMILAIWSAYCMYRGLELQAVYFILGALFMGRGQVVRMTARMIREELEAMERGE